MSAPRILGAVLATAILGFAPHGAADEEAGRCAHYEPQRQPLFGDLHVHTRYSLDASTQGTRTTPEQAYRFARGERVGLQPWAADGTPGRNAQLPRALDFASVTDHAELFGEVAICTTPGLPGYESFVCRVYRGWPRLAFFTMNARGSPRFSFCGEDGSRCLEAGRGPWLEMREAAETAYDRSPACRFTSLIGYEWTKSVELGSNLHRNVIFAGASVPEYPASSTDYPTPEALWEVLDADCRRTRPGCDALVIPHNSNISGGWMFAETDSEGSAIDADYARRRAANEPLVEAIQHKGGSECALGRGTSDELCGFENLPYDSFTGRFSTLQRRLPDAINFTRSAQAQGLQLRARLGANPFEFGVIGSTDTHLGTPGLVQEYDYPGHGGAGLPVGEVLPEGLLDPIEYNPGGLAAVWAEENTRPAVFAALKRRETYATSGPRIVLRSFGGWNLAEDLCGAPDFAARGYAGGVPMGGSLPARPDADSAPRIAAWAQRDAGPPGRPGTALQRLQVVKLWVDEEGSRERVFEVAGDPRNGATVDPETCAPSGPGADGLCAVWSDPEFDPQRPALYYVRAVENPTCRWHAQACNAAGVRCEEPSTVGRGWEPCCDPDYPREIQERAWSSPIWYTPHGD